MKNEEERAKIMNELLEKHEEQLSYLYFRWQDEKQYEDWNDYAEQMKKMFGKMFVKATKRPFGVTLKIEGFPYQPKITVTSRDIGWGS